MALALLELEGLENDAASFQVELGENAWFMYAIGRGDVEQVQGLPMLADPVFESPTQGPLPRHARGRTSFTVPLSQFDREHRAIQLMSFRTHSHEGPALSDIVRVPRTTRGDRANGARTLTVPAGRLRAQQLSRVRQQSATRRTSAAEPFYLVEASSRGTYSSAMFVETLMGMLPTLLNAAGPLLGNLFGGVFGALGGNKGGAAQAQGPGSPAGIAGAVMDFLKSPDNAKMITQLISSAVGTVPAATPAPTPAPAVSPTLAAPKSLRMGRARSRANSVSRFERARLAQAQFVDGGVVTGPMIAMLIGQLAPLIEKFLTPETVNTLLTSATPQAMHKMGMEWANFLADPNAARAERLWKNTPQVGPNALPGLLATMESAPPTPVPTYRGVPNVNILIDGLTPILLNGSSRVVYRAGRDISLALRLDTPRTIADATLHWVIRHKETGAVFAHGSRPYQTLESGPLESLDIGAGALASVPVREPCFIGVHLVWNAKNGDAIGVSKVQLCWFADEFVYDRVEEAGELIPLNDVSVHRDFWHRIWEGNTTARTARVEIECKYYYALEDRPANTPLTTQRRRGNSSPLRIRSGMILSLPALASLRSTLGATEPLEAGQLAALDNADFRRRAAQAGLTQVDVRARKGERAALWVYPEVKLQRVVFQRIQDVGPDGQVADTEEVATEFPLPALIHVIGARTQA